MLPPTVGLRDTKLLGNTRFSAQKTLEPNSDNEKKGNRYLAKQHNWNNPMTDDGSAVPSTSPETQGSEPSRSTLPPSPPEPKPTQSFEAPVVSKQRSEPEAPTGSRVQSSLRISPPEEETMSVPPPTGSSGPRMIPQSPSGRSSQQNAFVRLKSMSSSIDHPEKLPGLPPPGDLGRYGYSTKKTAQESQTHYPGYKLYQLARCNCCLSTFFTLLIVLLAIVAIICAVWFDDTECQLITVIIIVVSLILLLIMSVEWIREWLWREPTVSKKRAEAVRAVSAGQSEFSGGLPTLALVPGQLPNPTYSSMVTGGGRSSGGFTPSGPPRNLYEIQKFVSAICLFVLYMIGLLFIIGLIAASGVKLGTCPRLATNGIAYAAILIILFCTRMALCCGSEFCRGLCIQMGKKKRKKAVPVVSDNQLHQYLPRMGGHWHSGGETTAGNGLPSAWLVNLASSSDPKQQLSIIKPMPMQYGNELA